MASFICIEFIHSPNVPSAMQVVRLVPRKMASCVYFNEKLIETVRLYEHLNSPANKSYHDSGIKENSWEETATSLNAT
ncbi:hypothetical protein J6590_106026, partial [Homalodisca vitripennis]